MRYSLILAAVVVLTLSSLAFGEIVVERGFQSLDIAKEFEGSADTAMRRPAMAFFYEITQYDSKLDKLVKNRRFYDDNHRLRVLGELARTKIMAVIDRETSHQATPAEIKTFLAARAPYLIRFIDAEYCNGDGTMTDAEYNGIRAELMDGKSIMLREFALLAVEFGAF